MTLHVPAKTWVLVCDGGKAIFYRNTGSARHIALSAEHTLEEHHPPTRELGTDRPGRSVDSHDGSRSAVETTDWHEQAEKAFLKRAAAMAEKIATDGTLIVVAPPRALGIIREHLGPEGRRIVLAEMAKDLVKMPKGDVENYLQAQTV